MIGKRKVYMVSDILCLVLIIGLYNALIYIRVLGQSILALL